MGNKNLFWAHVSSFLGTPSCVHLWRNIGLWYSRLCRCQPFATKNTSHSHFKAHWGSFLYKVLGSSAKILQKSDFAHIKKVLYNIGNKQNVCLYIFCHIINNTFVIINLASLHLGKLSKQQKPIKKSNKNRLQPYP